MNRIPETLKQLGISPEHKGYHYLIKAIELTMCDFEVIHHTTKALYPAIAEAFDEPAHNVESHIRRAIERGWPNGCPAFKQRIFKCTIPEDKRPTNTAFIATIADWLKRNKPQMEAEENTNVYL